MKKLSLITIALLSTSLFAAETYDISNLIKDKYSFKSKGELKMVVPDGKSTLNLPISLSIVSNGATKIDNDKYEIKSKTNVTMILPDGKKSITKTDMSMITDEWYRVTQMTEVSNSDGKKSTIKCKIMGEVQGNKSLILPIGYVSEKEVFLCDDDSKRTTQMKLLEGESGRANLVVTQKAITKLKGDILIINETTVVDVDKSGKMYSIQSKIESEDKFVMKYKTEEIK